MFYMQNGVVYRELCVLHIEWCVVLEEWCVVDREWCVVHIEWCVFYMLRVKKLQLQIAANTKRQEEIEQQIQRLECTDDGNQDTSHYVMNGVQ